MHIHCTVPSAMIRCDQFEPDMFVNLLINSTDKGAFEIFLNDNENNHLLEVTPDYSTSVSSLRNVFVTLR